MKITKNEPEKTVSRYQGNLTESQMVLKKRTICNSTCRYYLVCPIRSIALIDGVCLLAKLPQTDIQTFVNLFLEKNEGLIHEMLLSLWHYKQNSNVTGSKRDAKEYFNLLVTLHKEIYGTVKGSESVKDLSIVVTEVGLQQDDPQMRVIKSDDPRLNGIGIDDAVYDPDDPESLFTSPVIDNIKKNK